MNQIDKRKQPRFEDFARVKAPGISKLSGILEDASVAGCKVRFSHVENLDLETEYVLEVFPAIDKNMSKFEVEAKIVWKNPEKDAFYVGFTLLPSAGSKALVDYIEKLAEMHEE